MRLTKTIYLDPLWSNVQQHKENGTAELFHFSTMHGTIKYPFIKRYAGRIDDVDYYDIVTARGECGPVVFEEFNSNLYADFDECFQRYCNENRILAEYIRFDPWNSNPYKFADIYNISAHGFAYCHKLQEDFFTTQYSSKRRNQIRKAIKSGVEVETDSDWSNISYFLDLYRFTIKKHDVSAYYYLDEDFLNRYKDMLGNKVKLGLAYYQDKIIAGGLFLNGGDVYHYHFSASDPNFAELNAISLLLYYEGKKGAEEGCTIMDLGGATPNSGLERFKQSMVKADGILPCYVGTKIRNKSIYDTLVKKQGSMPEGYFPAYRRIVQDIGVTNTTL